VMVFKAIQRGKKSVLLGIEEKRTPSQRDLKDLQRKGSKGNKKRKTKEKKKLIRRM